MDLVGANAQAQATGLDAQGGTSNYFVGNDPSQWHTGIANYGQVKYQNVYSGVNLIYYGNQRQLEYDFVLAPGADPGSIQLAFTGAAGIPLDSSGDLVLHTSGGDVVEHAPVIYQDNNGVRQAVSGHYVLEANRQVGFEVGAYDPTKSLVIDPVLSYSTYLGGSGSDQAYAIAVDGPVTPTSRAQPLLPTSRSRMRCTRTNGRPIRFCDQDQFRGNGARLFHLPCVTASFTCGYGIAVDASGDAYITGTTSQIPTTTGAFQTSPGGGSTYDAFVTKLNPTGSALVYSTYLGGSGRDRAMPSPWTAPATPT